MKEAVEELVESADGTSDIIPYHKEYRGIAKSITATILLQQLEYWFRRKPLGFFKFLAPCEHEDYAPGDSWIEELAFSKDEFRAAFDKIGLRYDSKSEFDKAKEKFIQNDVEFCYCSYHDRITGHTYYRRNHKFVNASLREARAEQTRLLQEQAKKADFRKSKKSTSVNRKSQLTEVGIPDLDNKESETTTKTTTEKGETPFDADEFVDTPPLPQERLQGQLTPIEATVLEITAEPSRHWSKVEKARAAATAFVKLGITVADLHEFDQQRAKTCKLNFIESEVGTWWRDKRKSAAPREPVDINEKYKSSPGARFVIVACGLKETMHAQHREDVQEIEALGRDLDISLSTCGWGSLSPRGFIDYWRNECQSTFPITPKVIRKYFGQYREHAEGLRKVA